MSDTKPRKPLFAKFEIPISEDITAEELDSRLKGSGPKATTSGGDGVPKDHGIDVDFEF